MNKIYIVAKGRKTGIFFSWDDCKEQVHKYPSALYKSLNVSDKMFSALLKKQTIRF